MLIIYLREIVLLLISDKYQIVIHTSLHSCHYTSVLLFQVWFFFVIPCLLNIKNSFHEFSIKMGFFLSFGYCFC